MSNEYMNRFFKNIFNNHDLKIISFQSTLLMKYFFLFILIQMLSLVGKAQTNDLMPVPSSVLMNKTNFRLSSNFSIAVSGQADDRLFKEASRFFQRLSERTGLFFKTWNVTKENVNPLAALQIHSNKKGIVQINMDESYELIVDDSKISIKAETDIGAIRGLETLLQLIISDQKGFYFKGVTVKDSPRFAWRGLLISQPYHFMPMDVVKRTLDAMAMVKMNVLHLYISDDQGYTIESKVFPKLHQQASGGNYFTQLQIAEIIQYADQRGIRVVPEIDLPGHSTAILTAFPELASIPRAYQLQDHWGVFDPTVDPTKEKNYVFLDTLLTEVASLFPDHYFHIGGDENTGRDWAKSLPIQAFMKEKGLNSTVSLQNYFNRHIQTILKRSGKTVVGWDEILMKKMDDAKAKAHFEKSEFDQLIEQDVPKDIVVQSWRGMEALLSSAKNGYKSILSKGYYIDLVQPTSYHYLNDPIPFINKVITPDSEANLNRFESEIIKKIEKGEKILTSKEEELIIGGEATMWTEHVSAETFDSRVWPRTAAIAERLWSPATVRDVDDMYRRLDIISLQLESVGSTHLKNKEMMLRRIAGTENIQPLENVVDFIEPLKGYKRNAANNFTKYSPYSLLVDIAVPDPSPLRAFNKLIDSLIKQPTAIQIKSLYRQLNIWKTNHQLVIAMAVNKPLLATIAKHSTSLNLISKYTLEFLDSKERDQSPTQQWMKEYLQVLNESMKPAGYCELLIGESLKKMITNYKKL
jgi:hexosaminidase